MAATSTGWRADVLKQLARRDRQQSGGLASLVESRAQLARSVRQLDASNAQLLSENKALKERNEQLVREGPRAGGANVDELKAQYLEEIFHLHKTNKQLVEAKQRADEELRRREDSEFKLRDNNFHLEKRFNEVLEMSKAKEQTLQVLQDELQALRLFVAARDEKMRELELENKNLIERWIQKLNEEAAKSGEPTKDAPPRPPPGSSAANAASPMDPNDPRRAPVPVATVIIPTTVKRKFVGHESDINTIQCGMTGRFFATGSNDLKIKIHDATGVLKTTINGCTQSVMCVQFSRGDEWILGASNDHATRIWGVETGRLRHTLTGHVGKVFSARFSYDTTKVVTGSHDRTLKIWDLQKGNCIRNIFCFSSCNDLCLLDDSGSSIASGHLDSQLRIWDARSGNCVTELVDLHQGQITSLTLSPDNHSLLTNSRDGTLKLVDLRSSRALSTFTAENYRPGVNWARACFSPDGAYALAGSQEGHIFAWSVATGKVEQVLRAHQSAVVGVTWNASAGYVYSADKNKTIVVWEP